MNLFPIRKGKFLFQLMASLTLVFSEGDATLIVTGSVHGQLDPCG